MSLRWALDRARAMGLREMGYRGASYLRARSERAGLGLARPMPPSAARGKPWIGAWPARLGSDAYRDAAERILEGEFRLFGGHGWQLGFPPDWNRDVATGTHAPLTFGKTLNYRDPALVGNIKYLWEPNRHLELVTLAQACRLTGEARFAAGCRILIDSWIAQCPYMRGPNWTSSLELGLRLVNWSCAWHILGGDEAGLFREPGAMEFKERWLNAVRQHCHFIAGHLSLHSSANNHLLGELLGLFIGATTWPCWRESEDWRERARRRFEEQALLQNDADGVNREQAIWYQHEVVDMMLMAGLTARANGCDFGPAFWSRLEAMLGFICCCMDVRGHVPALGDSDDAVIVRFSPQPDFAVYRSLLASGAVLFGRGDFKHKAQAFDDKSRWLLGDAAADTFAAMQVQIPSQQVGRRFAGSGYYILGSDLESAREVRVVFDAASLGYLSIAAHGHADALSFTLSVCGVPLLIDSGTYAYHTERPWRDYFRGTAAHNTLRVDGLDQSVSAGPFLWSRHANARSIECALGQSSQRLVAEHDGYLRLADAVVHRREIIYECAARTLTVTDRLECNAQHLIEIFWHFPPECGVKLSAGTAHATLQGVGLELTWPVTLDARVARGNEEPIEGWISARFGERDPADTLVISGRVDAGWEGVTAIKILLRSTAPEDA
jgi:hypothetical protein